MPRFVKTSNLPVPPRVAFDWHARPGALPRLIPPWQRVRVIASVPGKDGSPIGKGARVVLGMRVLPGVELKWVAQHGEPSISGELENLTFLDEQVSGPFQSWSHKHGVAPTGDGRARLTDSVDYRLPAGSLGRALGGASVRRTLERAFAYRHRVTRDDLAQHATLDATPMTVGITGSSGLVGSHLAAMLTAGGHRVVRLVRHDNQARADDAVLCDPLNDRIDRAGLDTAALDAVVHLAGEPVIGRWTDDKKRAIRESRVDATLNLCRALADLDTPPRTLVSASAAGYYGDRGDDVLAEGEPVGRGFLSDVAQAWERACDRARAAGLRVVHPRIGLVLSGRGGALASMRLPFALGLAGPLGGGGQWWPWIAIDDLAGLILHALATPDLHGPVNAVAPQPVTNATFTRTLARVLRRPAVIPAPRFALRAALGEMADVLMHSQRCSADAALNAGYRFRLTDLEDCLRHELGRPAEAVARDGVEHAA